MTASGIGNNFSNSSISGTKSSATTPVGDKSTTETKPPSTSLLGNIKSLWKGLTLSIFAVGLFAASLSALALTGGALALPLILMSASAFIGLAGCTMFAKSQNAAEKGEGAADSKPEPATAKNMAPSPANNPAVNRLLNNNSTTPENVGNPPEGTATPGGIGNPPEGTATTGGGIPPVSATATGSATPTSASSSAAGAGSSATAGAPGNTSEIPTYNKDEQNLNNAIDQYAEAKITADNGKADLEAQAKQLEGEIKTLVNNINHEYSPIQINDAKRHLPPTRANNLEEIVGNNEVISDDGSKRETIQKSMAEIQDKRAELSQLKDQIADFGKVDSENTKNLEKAEKNLEKILDGLCSGPTEDIADRLEHYSLNDLNNLIDVIKQSNLENKDTYIKKLDPNQIVYANAGIKDPALRKKVRDATVNVLIRHHHNQSGTIKTKIDVNRFNKLTSTSNNKNDEDSKKEIQSYMLTLHNCIENPDFAQEIRNELGEQNSKKVSSEEINNIISFIDNKLELAFDGKLAHQVVDFAAPPVSSGNPPKVELPKAESSPNSNPIDKLGKEASELHNKITNDTNLALNASDFNKISKEEVMILLELNPGKIFYLDLLGTDIKLEAEDIEKFFDLNPDAYLNMVEPANENLEATLVGKQIKMDKLNDPKAGQYVSLQKMPDSSQFTQAGMSGKGQEIYNSIMEGPPDDNIFLTKAKLQGATEYDLMKLITNFGPRIKSIDLQGTGIDLSPDEIKDAFTANPNLMLKLKDEATTQNFSKYTFTISDGNNAGTYIVEPKSGMIDCSKVSEPATPPPIGTIPTNLSQRGQEIYKKIVELKPNSRLQLLPRHLQGANANDLTLLIMHFGQRINNIDLTGTGIEMFPDDLEDAFVMSPNLKVKLTNEEATQNFSQYTFNIADGENAGTYNVIIEDGFLVCKKADEPGTPPIDTPQPQKPQPDYRQQLQNISNEDAKEAIIKELDKYHDTGNKISLSDFVIDRDLNHDDVMIIAKVAGEAIKPLINSKDWDFTLSIDDLVNIFKSIPEAKIKLPAKGRPTDEELDSNGLTMTDGVITKIQPTKS